MTPTDAAQQRLAAVASLEAELAGYLTELQRRLYEGLLTRLQDVYDKPELIPQLLAEFTQLVHLPVVVYYARSVLTLPGLQEAYFDAVLGEANYAALRAPLTDFLQRTFGITAEGLPVAGGYLSTFLNDTGPARALLHYAYASQAAGVGLTSYREGLQDLVLGNQDAKQQGLYEKLYQQAGDDYSRADRTLQGLAAEELGLSAFLYQGGLIDSSRSFCRVRNGKVFLRSEVEKFGTSADAYGGYTNKSEGAFSGKPAAGYNPFEWCGGYSCRHALHAIPGSVALSLRPDLREGPDGKLFVP